VQALPHQGAVQQDHAATVPRFMAQPPL
jgi:hypothetical protein